MSRPNIAPTGFWDAEGAHLPGRHTCSLPLARWIAEYLKGMEDTRIYDFGCGVGAYLSVLNAHGFKYLAGFEGAPPAVRQWQDIQKHDLTTPLHLPVLGNVLSLEVAEHIPAEFESTFIDTITDNCRQTLIMSWAVVGQGGDGHVNCQNNDVVIPKIEKRGFQYRFGASAAARAAGASDGYHFWFGNTVMVFERPWRLVSGAV